MKASDYFKKYVDENQEEEKLYRVVKTFMAMFNEVKEIQEARKARTDTALIAILNEQNTKANSFIRKVNEIDDLGLKTNGFKDFVIYQMPELANMIGWKPVD